jgi:hypothetical protein
MSPPLSVAADSGRWWGTGRTITREKGADVTTPDSTSAAATVDRRALLADALGKLLQAGFAQNAVPVEGVIPMQRVWQGPDEDSVIVDSITIHTRDQALAVREGDGDGAPIWGPMRGPWSDLVAVFLALPPPDEFALVLVEGPLASATALPGGLS